MDSNVFIRLWKDGKLIDYREGHNIWVDAGREYLARLISLASFNPEVYVETRRVHYTGFGIGSDKQSLLPVANSSPIVDSYPGGYDPIPTTGNEYDIEFPPPITTLERPIRITAGSGGGLKPYAGAVGGPPDPDDVWLTAPPVQFSNALIPGAPGGAVFRSLLDTTLGEILYGPFIQMPLSEVGLFLYGSNINEAYNTIVAYHSFDTILVVPGTLLEVSWLVGF